MFAFSMLSITIEHSLISACSVLKDFSPYPEDDALA